MGAIIGAIIGSVTTIFVFWYSQYRTSRRKLLDRLMLLKHDLQGETYPLNNDMTDSEPETWNKSFKNIWTLYNSFMDWAPFHRKCRMHKAWNQYKNDTIDGYQTFLTEPESKEDFVHKIDNLINSM